MMLFVFLLQENLLFEQALDYIAEDELVEVTPNNIRLRKNTTRRSQKKSK